MALLRTSTTINYNGAPFTVEFKTGGEIDDPRKPKNGSAGQVYNEGEFATTTTTGNIVLSNNAAVRDDTISKLKNIKSEGLKNVRYQATHTVPINYANGIINQQKFNTNYFTVSAIRPTGDTGSEKEWYVEFDFGDVDQDTYE